MMAPAAACRVAAGAATDVGRVRSHNEDAFLAAVPVFLVADGMGGHARGAAASALVVGSFEPLAGRDWLAAGDVHQAAAAAAIRLRGLAGYGPPPGSTLAGVALTRQNDRPCWLVFNIGDSRVYLMRSGRLEQISIDHSRRQELLNRGVADEAITVGRNVITRALGAGRSSAPLLDQWLVPMVAGDRVLVCSDGLTGEVPHELLRETLQTHPDPQDAARILVDLALASEARDNVTAVVVDCLEVVGGGDCDETETLRPEESMTTPLLEGSAREGRSWDGPSTKGEDPQR